MSRTGEIVRDTKETQIRVAVDLDGTGVCKIETGIGFFDHMLEAFGRHSGIDLEVATKGDLHIDMHHTVEDTGIVLGQAVKQALDGFKGVRRFGSAYIPMDETLTRCALDLSNRPYLVWRVAFARPKIGEFDTELFKEFHHAFAMNVGACVHIETLYGDNSHHIAESGFKALARALRSAVELDPKAGGQAPSTKACSDPMPITALINYGSGNLRSAEKALRKAAMALPGGHEVVTTSDADVVAKADRVVLPGVGAFAACMGALKVRDGMVEAIEAAVKARGAPFLGICVGMQLLATRGLEFGETPGLGWIAGDVRRLQPTEAAIKVPHMGWNDVRPETPSALLRAAPTPQYYFTHSFAFYPNDANAVTASVENGERFAAAVERGNVAGVQFHPEKSQAEGLAFLSRFLEWRP